MLAQLVDSTHLSAPTKAGHAPPGSPNASVGSAVEGTPPHAPTPPHRDTPPPVSTPERVSKPEAEQPDPAARTVHVLPAASAPTIPPPSMRATAQAQKLAKWAVSALDYEDIATARQCLRDALAALDG